MPMQFQIHSNFEPSLETDWNALLESSHTNAPFLRFGYLRQWWQTRGGGEWPDSSQLMLVTAREGEELVGVAPLFLAEYENIPTLMLVGATEISDFLDFICQPQSLPGFVSGLLDFLHASGQPAWSRMILDNIPDTSPTLALIQDWAARNQHTFSNEPLHPAPFIRLNSDWEGYLASLDKKQRHEIRRKMRRAEEKAGSLLWRTTRDISQLEQDEKEFLALMSFDDDKKCFLTNTMNIQMAAGMRWAMDEGILLLAFLEIDQQPAAAYYCFDYANAIWVYNTGINPAFMEYSPGWVLLAYLLRWANENHRAVFDFMRGGEDYKYRFGAVKRWVTRSVLQRAL